MKGEASEIASYYLWKWADNSVAGTPHEVYAALLRGEMHPALQPFDALPLLRMLRKSARRGRLLGEEWNWRVHPPATLQQAGFVFVTCPRVNAFHGRVERFMRDFLSLELSGWDEEESHLIPCLPPKTSVLILGQLPNETAYEIAAEAIPRALRRIDPYEPKSWVELLSGRSGVAAIARGRYFRVEWRDNHYVAKRDDVIQWRASDAARRDPAGACDTKRFPHPGEDPDSLSFADAVLIFEAFLHGDAKPAQFHWRVVKPGDE